MDDQDFDIQSYKDNRNLKAKGISGKSNNAKEVARRQHQTEKRAAQINNEIPHEVEELEKDLTKPKKYGNGKPKKQAVKDEPYVEMEEQLGKTSKKLEKNMRKE